MLLLENIQSFVLVFMIFMPLERFWPRRPAQRVLRRLWQTDVAHALIGGLVTAVGMRLLVQSGVAEAGPFIGAGIRKAVASQPVLVQVVESSLLADLVYYAVHRAFHRVPWLWRFHAVHHSIEELDWLAAHRVHPFDQILTRGLAMILPIAFGFSGLAWFISVTLFAWHSYLKHSNVKVGFGPLRFVLASPLFHHLHHANAAHAYNRNFAGQFPIIDIVFGTALMDERLCPPAYGTDEPVPDGFLAQLLSPLRRRPRPDGAGAYSSRAA